MKHPLSARAWMHRDLGFAALLVALGGAGLLDVRFGDWRPGPGGGNALVPAVAYSVLLAAGCVIALGRLRPGWSPDAQRLHVPVGIVAGALLWGGAFFLAVRHVGIGVSTTVLIAGAIWALTPPVDRRPGLIAVIALCSGLAFWVVFTQLAPILVASPLLF